MKRTPAKRKAPRVDPTLLLPVVDAAICDCDCDCMPCPPDCC
jgi:hypothetical protein